MYLRLWIDIRHPIVRLTVCQYFNTLRLRQNGHHFKDNISKGIFLNENVWISIFVLKSSINNSPALDQIVARRQPGNKPLSEPMMVSLLTHMWVTQPQWVQRKWTISMTLCKVIPFAVLFDNIYHCFMTWGPISPMIFVIKIVFVLFQIPRQWSLQKCAQLLWQVLLWHVHIMYLLGIDLERNEIPIKFALWWKNQYWNGPLNLNNG